MKIKKLFTMILACMIACVMTFAVTGCGEDEDTPSTGDVTGLSEKYGDWSGQTIEIAALDKGTGVEWLKDAVKTFNAGTGSKITMKSDETLNESLATFLDSKSGSDVYFSFSSQTQWIKWSLQDKIYCLDDLGLVYNETAEKMGVIDGHRYTMPYTYSPTGFIYNQDYIDEIPSNGEFTQGTFPETWQGLLDMCDSINNTWKKTVLSQQVVPMSWGGSVGDMKYIFYGVWAQIDPEGYLAYWNQTTESVADKGNKSLLVNEGFIKAIDSIAKLYNTKENAKQNYYPSNSFSDSTSHSNLIAEQKFLNGLSVFTISGSWFETEMAEQIEEGDIDFYHFAAAPKVNTENKTAIFMNSPAEYFMIAKNGKNNNPDLCKAFLKYLASENRCQVFQSYTGVPTPLQYKMDTSTLKPFAKEIAEIMQDSLCVVAASDQKASLCGAIDLNLTMTYNKLATSKYTSTLASEIAEEIYSTQVYNWNDYMKAFE